MKKYVIYLKEFKKKIKVLGFYNIKEVPDFAYSKLEYDFFSLKDTDFLGRPKHILIDNFISEDFDLLIDVNVKKHFSLKYISALSNAKFKVGEYNVESVDIYDLMINIEKERTLKYFLKQIDIYIPMLNNSMSK